MTLADTLVDDDDVADVLHQLAGYCVRLLGVAAAGLMLVDHFGELKILASSDERGRLLELLELQHNEGPCPTCFHTGHPVLVADITAEHHRWPTFVPVLRGGGFHAKRWRRDDHQGRGGDMP